MLVRLTHASPAKLCLYLSPEPIERRQLRRLPAYRTKTVRLESLAPRETPMLTLSAPRSTVATVSTRSKLARDEIKWPELLAHFRAVQTRHERARRTALGSAPDISATLPSSALPERPAARRRVTGLGEVPAPPSSGSSGTGGSTAGPSNGRPGALSPLNPRARVQGGVATTLTAQGQVLGARPKRGLSLVRKT